MFANSLKQNHSADQRVGSRRPCGGGGGVDPVQILYESAFLVWAQFNLEFL